MLTTRSSIPAGTNRRAPGNQVPAIKRLRRELALRKESGPRTAAGLQAAALILRSARFFGRARFGRRLGRRGLGGRGALRVMDRLRVEVHSDRLTRVGPGGPHRFLLKTEVGRADLVGRRHVARKQKRLPAAQPIG